ncbi:MAG: hypothetical protein GKR91_07190 [Pseudomonadales bacterium]|nr:hypothetical protein [Pseudomonadales bacterium]
MRSYPDIENEKYQISIDGGFDAQWTADGNELIYRKLVRGNDEFYSVAVETENEFSAESPHFLFSIDYSLSITQGFSISEDGQRLLMVKPVRDDNQRLESRDINLAYVVNFDNELERLVTVDSH